MSITRFNRNRRKAIKRHEKAERQIVILPKHVLFFLCFLCFVIMFVSYKFPAALKPVKYGVDLVVSPMQKGINRVGSKVSSKLKNITTMKQLQAENAELKEQVSRLTETARLTIQDRYELENLRQLYGLDNTYSEYPKIGARIIARESNGWYDLFTIDKGSDDGILKDMNVIAGNGLVGLVTEVRKKTSTVRSIIDDSSHVSAMFSVSEDTCMVNGNINLLKVNGRLDVTMISKNADFIENEELVTSRISDKYLPGILIGYIKEVYPDSSEMTQEGFLVPAVDFEKLSEVLIITELKKKDE